MRLLQCPPKRKLEKSSLAWGSSLGSFHLASFHLDSFHLRQLDETAAVPTEETTGKE